MVRFALPSAIASLFCTWLLMSLPPFQRMVRSFASIAKRAVFAESPLESVAFAFMQLGKSHVRDKSQLRCVQRACESGCESRCDLVRECESGVNLV
jgi:hypothetical protein